MNGVATGGYIQSQQHGLLLTKADLAFAASQCQTYEKQINAEVSSMALFLKETI